MSSEFSTTNGLDPHWGMGAGTGMSSMGDALWKGLTNNYKLANSQFDFDKHMNTDGWDQMHTNAENRKNYSQDWALGNDHLNDADSHTWPGLSTPMQAANHVRPDTPWPGSMAGQQNQANAPDVSDAPQQPPLPAPTPGPYNGVTHDDLYNTGQPQQQPGTGWGGWLWNHTLGGIL